MITFAKKAHAHVRYIADDTTVEALSGSDFAFLVSPLLEKENIIIIAVSLIVILSMVIFLPRIDGIKERFKKLTSRASSYKDLVPWMARLSLGIALVGAGTAGYLINPVVQNAAFSQIQIILGFLLMSGFLMSITPILVILLFVVAFTYDWYLIGALDVFVLALSLVVLDSQRPGVDHLLGLPDLVVKKWRKFIPQILRIGTGIGLTFLAVYEKILNPHLSAHVVDVTNLQNVIPVSPEMWVLSAGSIEALLGILLIIGYRVRLVSVVTFIVLALSFFYFKEDVTSHITLFGVMSIIFILGGSKKKK